MGRRHGGLTKLVSLASKLPSQITGGLGLRSGSRGKSVTTVSLLNSKQFEKVVSAGFRHRGFEVAEYAGSSADGVDVVLTRENQRYLVRCEQWRAQPIGTAVIRMLADAVLREGARGGYVVSPGRFTRQARELAGRAHVDLFDEKNIDELVGLITSGTPRTVG